MLTTSRTVSVAVVLCSIGALLLISACGFIPPARPSPQPDTFILEEDSALGRVLGHGSLRMTNSVHTRAAITLYGQPAGEVSTVDFEGLLVLTLPRHLLLHGVSGKAKLSLSAVTPGPLTGEGESGCCHFPAGSRSKMRPASGRRGCGPGFTRKIGSSCSYPRPAATARTPISAST